MIIITIIYTTNVQIETWPNETKSRLFYFLKEDHLSIRSRKYDIFDLTNEIVVIAIIYRYSTRCQDLRIQIQWKTLLNTQIN